MSLTLHVTSFSCTFLINQNFQPPSNAQGLPLGQYNYEPKRLAMEAERNRDYNKLLSKVALRTRLVVACFTNICFT